MKKKLITLLLACSCITLNAENIDSLYQIVKTTENDSLKAYKFRDLALTIIENDIDRIDEVLSDFETFTKKSSDKTSAFACYYEAKGEWERRKGNGKMAVELFKKALPLYIENGDLRSETELNGNLGFTYHQAGDIQAGLKYVEKAVQQSKKLGDPRVEARAIDDLGSLHRSLGNTNKSIEYTNQALAIYREHNCCLREQVITTYNLVTVIADKNPKAAIDSLIKLDKIAQENDFFYVGNFILNQLAASLIENGDMKEGLKYSYKAAEAAKKQNNLQQLAIAYRSLGNCFSIIQDDGKADQYFSQAVTIVDTAGLNDIRTFVVSDVSTFYTQKGDYDKARAITEKSLAIATEQDMKMDMSILQINLGDIYMKTNAPNKAKELYNKTVKMDVIDTDVKYAKTGLADLALKNKDYSKAIDYAKETLTYGQETGANDMVDLSSYTLYEAYKNTGRSDLALKFYEMNTAIKQKMLNEKNIREATAKELSYQFEEEKKQIEFEQAKQEAIYATDLKRQKTQRNAFIGAFAGVALLAFLLYRSYRIKQKSNQALEEKNALITTQKEELENLNYTKDRIFAIIGHDLRKPAIAFRGITKKINYLIKKERFDDLAALGESLEEDAFALNSLTDNLLNWALSQKDMVSYNPEKVYLKDVAEELAPLFKRLARDKQINFKTDIPEDMSVLADKNALLTIMRNLIDNAVKFTAEGGDITVSAEQKDGDVITKISDTGVGMPKEKLKDLFVMKKGKTERGTAGEKGTGLGLSLVNELVKINKGIIEVSSQLGKGTTFNIQLPKVAA